MNKKAQLGKIITTLPVMILLILIMALFVALSAGAVMFKGKTQPTPSSFVLPENNPLFQTTEIEVNNNKQEVPLIDIIKPILEDSTKSRDELWKALNTISEENSKCIILFDGEFILYPPVSPNIMLMEKYPDSVTKTPVKINQEEHLVIIYFGPCEVANE